MQSEAQYIELYRGQRSLIHEHSAAVMNALRDAAANDLERTGFPSRKVERYRYTDVEALFAPDYGLNLRRLDIPVNPYEAFRCDVPNLSTQLFFVINDAFHGASLPKNTMPEGVEVASLKTYAEQHPDFVAAHYGQLAHSADDAITALNTMLAQDGLLIHVKRGVKIDKAIQVINILRSDVALMANRRVLIVLDDDAEATLLFCDHAADDLPFLTTQVVEVFMGEGASLQLYCLEETHYKNTRVSNVYINQQAHSQVHHGSITLHNGITRNSLNVTLHGEGASCTLNGCVIADKEQHVDNNTLIDHAACHCTSRELYKYVLDEKAVGAFAGKVLVRPGAQHTESQETNQNLCATPDARMFTQPMLEIYADDVKCSHGSTVGQLNEAALFYMRQRGIPLHEAKTLLQQAFVGEVIEQIALAPLRDRLRYLVEKRFRGELNKCEGCKLCK
ncbi:MAG: Fe-S cluster assembly protein SufD [Prevotella sp.]|nr:Fe-S cluster assembly protein SufD [Prevotella sp.]